MRLAVLLLLLAGCAEAPPPTEPTPARSFEETVAVHLEAISGRDLDTLLDTVSDSLIVIFPDGSTVENRQAYEDFHVEWFADSTWTMSFERLSEVVTDDMGTALVRWTLNDDTPRSGRQALLSLTFRVKDGAWRLVHDQNTAIETKG